MPCDDAPEEAFAPTGYGAQVKSTEPGEIIAGGRSRLAAASIALSVVIAIVFGFMNLAPLEPPVPMGMANVVAALCVLLCLAVVVFTRTDMKSERLLDIAFSFEVAGALGIALAEALATHPRAGVRGVSWVCLWIALFPLVVPTTPGRTLSAAMTSATMGLIAIYLAVAMGVPRPSFSLTIYLIAPNFGAAGLAVLFSRVIYRLGTDARRARELGSYQLVELLGRGGMGEVWRAKHRMLARPAAIKLVTPEALGGKNKDELSVLKRFEREARATAMLSSLNTIHIYDFGRTADGTLYYVMELLDGVDLETLVEQTGPLPPERVVFLLRQVCASLAEAHSSGLIHRDIKPANIYVCRLGDRHDCVKVLDFGIVAIRDDAEGATAATRLTGENAIAGTPAYMAPETVTDADKVDHRVDIYALGCVAYWLVTGELVFDGETAVKIIFGHMEETPVPPQERMGSSLPDGLQELILDCLAKSPNDRPSSAAEIADRLDAIVLADPWTEARAKKWWKGRPMPSREPVRSEHQKRDTIFKV
jgi:serine/threonine-protein kinase